MNELDRENHRGDQEEGDEGKPAKAEPEECGGSHDRRTNEIATSPHVLDREEDPDAEGDDHEVREDRSRQTLADGPSARDSIPCRHRTDDTRLKRHGHLIPSVWAPVVPTLHPAFVPLRRQAASTPRRAVPGRAERLSCVPDSLADDGLAITIRDAAAAGRTLGPARRGIVAVGGSAGVGARRG